MAFSVFARTNRRHGSEQRLIGRRSSTVLAGVAPCRRFSRQGAMSPFVATLRDGLNSTAYAFESGQLAEALAGGSWWFAADNTRSIGRYFCTRSVNCVTGFHRAVHDFQSAGRGAKWEEPVKREFFYAKSSQSCSVRTSECAS
jgi:hypothetical protein